MKYGMMSDGRSKAQEAIGILSELILSHSLSLAQEQRGPGYTADSSDEYMAARKEWIKELRDIRERLENLVTGVV